MFDVAERNPELLGYRVSSIMWAKAAYFDDRLRVVTISKLDINKFINHYRLYSNIRPEAYTISPASKA